MKTDLRTSTKRLGSIVALTILASVMSPIAAQAAVTHTVCPLPTACQFTTINAAIVAANTGDRIEVGPGDYKEDVLVNKAVTIVGTPPTLFAPFTAMPRILGSTNVGGKSALTFQTTGATVSGFDITREYLTDEITNWNFNNTGVIFLSGNSSNTLTGNVITKNRNGVYLNNTTGNTISGNTIANNRTGIQLVGNVNGTQIKNNTISQNWTLGLIAYDDAPPPNVVPVPVNFSTITLTGNHFDNNWNSEIEIKDSAGTGALDIKENTFSDSPVTFSILNSGAGAAAGINELGHTLWHPLIMGGTDTAPAAGSIPTIRIYNSSNVLIKKTLTVGVNQNYPTLQLAIAAATAGDTIKVMAGTYVESGQIIINKDLTIIGAGLEISNVIIKPAQDTVGTTHEDGSAWFLIGTGKTVNISNLTLNGDGKNINTAILDRGLGTIEKLVIMNIKFDQITGTGIYLAGNATVKTVSLTAIGRIGVFVGVGATAAVIEGVTYVGKGPGVWLDYGIEVGRGGVATITTADISRAEGVASDGSTSSGIYVTTFFALGTKATITNSYIHDNTFGITVGYDVNDTSVVTAHKNNIIKNSVFGVKSTSGAVTTDATENWWGSSNPADVAAKVSTKVTYLPYYVDEDRTTLSSAPTITSATITGSALVGSTLSAVVTGVLGAPTPNVSYVWLRGAGTSIAISGATGSTYTLTDADIGKNISVEVTARNGITPNAIRASAPTALVSAAPVMSYVVTASAGVNGSVTPTGSSSVISGSSRAYAIAAAPGYQISDVLVDGVSTGAISTYTFTNVTAPHTISATFVALPVAPPVTPPTGGGAPAGPAPVDPNIAIAAAAEAARVAAAKVIADAAAAKVIADAAAAKVIADAAAAAANATNEANALVIEAARIAALKLTAENSADTSDAKTVADKALSVAKSLAEGGAQSTAVLKLLTDKAIAVAATKAAADKLQVSAALKLLADAAALAERNFVPGPVAAAAALKLLTDQANLTAAAYLVTDKALTAAASKVVSDDATALLAAKALIDKALLLAASRFVTGKAQADAAKLIVDKAIVVAAAKVLADKAFADTAALLLSTKALQVAGGTVSATTPGVSGAATTVLDEAAALEAAKLILGSSTSLDAALSVLVEAIAVQKAKNLSDKKVVQSIFFTTSSAKLDATDKADLKKFAATLKAQGSTAITLTGYADSKEGKSNKSLSLQRANAIASYLQSFGIDVTVKTVGKGSTSPLTGKKASTSMRVDLTIQT